MSELADLERIRDRYAQERARRLREDGNDQYHYVERREDPWAEPIVRDPLHDEVDVIVLGAGLCGLTTAAMLRKEGIDRIRLVDRAGGVGGTWWWNRYPAAQCDSEAYVYLPLLEELKYVPTEKYAYQPEILAHCDAIAREFDLYADAVFQTEVLECEWDEADARWIVRTDRGDAMRTRFLVAAGGIMQRPKLPKLPGLDEFQGKMFHTSLWDYGYTGGGPGRDGGGLPNLHDKRVGLVGTGCTTLQALTPLAHAAEHVYVFQRTPSVVLPRGNRPTDAEWAKGLQPGWSRQRVTDFDRLSNGMTEVPDEVQDGWTQVVFPLMSRQGAGLHGGEEARLEAERFDLATMEAIRRRVADMVEDPETAAKLMPYYRLLCKRPGFHDEYLLAYNRPNVTLVDTAGAGLERVTTTGVVAGGQKYELDCLILATGFDLGRGLLKAWEVDFVGRDGLRMSDYWEPGMRTYHGVTVRNFPNLFFNGITQVAPPMANNNVHNVEISDHIAYIIGQARARGIEQVEPSADAEEGWVQTIQSLTPPGIKDFQRACTPSYFNSEGHPERSIVKLYLGGSQNFYGMLRDWRNEDTLDGLELTPALPDTEAVGA